jgi:Skp family chaperone for outer membrane proteins
MGLMAIYPAAVMPIVIMGIVLGLGKISGTVWLKQNWENAPIFLRAYILPAVIALMLITSLGVFGYLSKAHSDQSLVSGDVQSKIAVYDEKIKTAKDNIDANRKALKQMDEAVDQVMGRSSDEKGADKAVAIRKSQQKERARLQAEIQTEQKIIGQISEERAPIAAEVRKVEAEVGPIKYIAHLLYGENPDANVLEKAVIWVTVLIVIVLDPLAVVLLLASQYSFQYFRERKEEQAIQDWFVRGKEHARQLDEEAKLPIEEGDSPAGPDVDVISTDTTVTTASIDPHQVGWMYSAPPAYEPDDGPLTDTQVEQIQETVADELPKGPIIETSLLFPEQQPEYVTVDGQRMHYKVAKEIYNTRVPTGAYVQNEEQSESSKWNRVISYFVLVYLYES